MFTVVCKKIYYYYYSYLRSLTYTSTFFNLVLSLKVTSIAIWMTFEFSTVNLQRHVVVNHNSSSQIHSILQEEFVKLGPWKRETSQFIICCWLNIDSGRCRAEDSKDCMNTGKVSQFSSLPFLGASSWVEVTKLFAVQCSPDHYSRDHYFSIFARRPIRPSTKLRPGILACKST
jgi:hypothetical protein